MRAVACHHTHTAGPISDCDGPRKIRGIHHGEPPRESFATLEYADWFHHRRLHTELGMGPSAEFEAEYPHRGRAPAAASQ